MSPVLQAGVEVDERSAMHGSTYFQPAKPGVLAFTWCALLYLLQPPAAVSPEVCDPSLLPGPCSCSRSFRSVRGGPPGSAMQTPQGGEAAKAKIDTSGKQQLTRRLRRWLLAAQCRLLPSMHPAALSGPQNWHWMQADQHSLPPNLPNHQHIQLSEWVGFHSQSLLCFQACL